MRLAICTLTLRTDQCGSEAIFFTARTLIEVSICFAFISAALVGKIGEKKMENIGGKSQSNMWRYLSYTRTSLRLVGLWPVSEEIYGRSGENSIKDTFGVFYFGVVAGSMILQSFQMLTNCWINYTNFESAAESIGPMMALVISFAKMCIYRHHRERLRGLIISFENCLKNGPSDVLEIVEDYAKIGSLTCGSLLAISWFLTVGYLTAPLMEAKRVLPFASWYPYDYENSTILYVLTYFHEVLLTCFGCCTMSTEITFVMFICYCCARLKVLRAHLEDLSNDDSEKKRSDTIGLKLSCLVKLHCAVLRDVEEINRAYTYIVMVLFFAAVIAICCAGLQVTSDSADSMSWTLLFVILAMYYAEQLLFYYLPGDMLAEEAMAVSFAAYASGWESFDIKHKKIINLMIMRSHLPPKLLAGKLSPLRLENYSNFLKTTGSYFTSIHAVTDA